MQNIILFINLWRIYLWDTC